MKSTLLRIVMGLSLVGLLGTPAQADKATTLNTGEIRKTLDDLKNEIKRMVEFENKADLAKDDLATRILGPDGRQMTQNEIEMDIPAAQNYQNEAWNDVGWLKDHWKELTSEQRHSVEEAESTLE